MTNENGNMYMPVVPQGYGNGGDGMFGGGSWAWWIIILLIFGGWGNGWGNGYGGGNGVGSEVQRGFDQSAVMSGISGIQSAVCGIVPAIQNGFAQAEIAANARQIADMNQNYAMQSAFQNCCCENRAGLADLKYTVATEACADRNAISTALRDVLESNNAGVQRILDTMCQDKIDAKNETIAMLRQQLQMAQMSASQGQQTAQILADNAAQTFALEQYLAPVPKPAYIVQNPNCCSQNFGCGCGAA